MFGNLDDDKYYDLSLKSFDLKDYDKSLEYINKAINMKPLNLNYRLHKINILIELYDYKNALKELKFMENIDNNNPGIYAYESMCYYSIDDYKNSLKFADKSLELDRENEIAYFYKAISLKNLDHYEESIKFFEKYLKMDNKNSMAHSELAELYFYVDRDKSAINEAKTALKYDNENEDAYDILLFIYKYNNDPVKYLETAIDAFENTANFDYLYNLNNVLIEYSMYDVGEDLYKNYIDINPDLPVFYDLFADILMPEDKKDDAYNAYKKILKNNDMNSYKLWFMFLINHGELNDAISEIKKFGHEDDEILNMLYLAYDNSNDYDNALKISEKLVNEYNDENGKIMCADQLNNLKRMDDALEYLDASEPENAYNKYYEYFRSYLYKKDYEKSMDYIKMVLNSDDDYVFYIFSELVDNSDEETVYKFLNTNHNDDLNDSFLLAESIADGIYKNSDEKFNELLNNNYIDCDDINEIKYKLTGKAREFIEKYEDKICNDN